MFFSFPQPQSLSNTKRKQHVNKDINVQAGTSKYVLPVHIKTKRALLRANPVRLGRTILNKDKLVAKHVSKDIHVQARPRQYALAVHIKTKQVLLVLVKPVQLEKYLQKALQHVTIYKICYKTYNH